MQEFEKDTAVFSSDEESYAWGIVENLGWGIESTDYKSIGKKLAIDYPNYIERLSDFVQLKRELLVSRLNEYANERGSFRTYYGIGDDSFWDLTAHIVGLGQEKYFQIFENPEIAKKMVDERDFVENFQYIFRNAKEYLEESNDSVVKKD